MFGNKKVVDADETRIKTLEAELKQKDKDFESEKRILNAEIQTKITEAVQVEREKGAELKEKNAVLSKEVEILEKAFENMGFDVKDMKSILDKLVDGIVSKNTINVVK